MTHPSLSAPSLPRGRYTAGLALLLAAASGSCFEQPVTERVAIRFLPGGEPLVSCSVQRRHAEEQSAVPRVSVERPADPLTIVLHPAPMARARERSLLPFLVTEAIDSNVNRALLPQRARLECLA